MKVPPRFFHLLVPGVLLAAWLAGLWLLSSLPGNDVKLPAFPHADKAAHFVYFFAGGFLVCWILRQVTAWPRLKVAVLAGLLIGMVGAADEFHQTFTPGRSGADHGDWIADVSGGLAGAWVFLVFYGIVTRTPHRAPPAGD